MTTDATASGIAIRRRTELPPNSPRVLDPGGGFTEAYGVVAPGHAGAARRGAEVLATGD